MFLGRRGLRVDVWHPLYIIIFYGTFPREGLNYRVVEVSGVSFNLQEHSITFRQEVDEHGAQFQTKWRVAHSGEMRYLNVLCSTN